MTPNNWSWGTIWSSAATATAKGLENMQAMAEQTAHAVSSNDKVRGLYAGVAPEIGRIGTDLSNLAKISANTIADTIAPPLVRGGLHGGPAGASFSSTIHVWFCADVPDPVVLEQLHNFVQTTLEEMWMKPFLPADSKTGAPLSANANPRIIQICDRVAVNSIQNPDPVVVKSLSEALAHSDVIIARLQTLSESHQSSASAHAENTHKPEGQDEAGPERACFLCVQPFSTILAPSQLFDATKHTQYLVTMVCDADTHRRVIETAIADLCEEFVVSVRF
ncbi:hypothetical protein BASA82_000776 [Batrachochytrium salamandrivorans]|nr:hypothetical protein BASA82_000776 [Batrachochytrium salamandrivorans]